MMRQVKLCVVLLALGWAGMSFGYDYSQSTNFGVLSPGDHVQIKVTPPKNGQGKDAIVTSGYYDNPDLLWKGNLADWYSTITPDYPSSHSGHFHGDYGYPGTGVSSRVLTWEAKTDLEVVKLETVTWATIPSDRTRKKLGVGEKVTLTLKGAIGSQVTWSKSGPGNISAESGLSITFTAYERDSDTSVAAHYKGKTYTANFSVVEPDIESAVKLSEISYLMPQGVGMVLDVTIHPTDVSFKNVEHREVEGPGSNFTGYFTNLPPDILYHHPKDWLPLNTLNTITDEPSFEGCPPPWYAGSYQWIIPVEWRVHEGAYVGTLPNRVQTMSITDTNGNCIIDKLGQSATSSY